MRDPRDATTAQARAKIAIEILKNPLDPYHPDEPAQGRRLDDCFEMGDGDEVYRIILRTLQTDSELAQAVKRQGLESWLNESRMLAEREVQPDLFGGEPRRVHRKARFDGDPKGRQLDLIPGMKDGQDQMVMFEEAGMPEELVWKNPEK